MNSAAEAADVAAATEAVVSVFHCSRDCDGCRRVYSFSHVVAAFSCQ